MRIGHVSTLPEMRCGIAIYAADLINALSAHEHSRFALHYGENPSLESDADCNVQDFRAVAALAQHINASDVDVVCLQHEFGIWGGPNGEHLLDFLDELGKPLVSTLHTTFPKYRRPAIQLHALKTLVERSNATFVLTDHSQSTLCKALGIPKRRVDVVYHGIPQTDFVALPELPHNGGTETWRFCSLGFFRPDKGLEKILEALAQLRNEGLQFEHVIAGEPQGQFGEQLSYRDRISSLIEQFGLEEKVRLISQFLSRDEQISLIQRCHAGIFAYQEADHASSGAIPLVLAAGRPVISTPFEFARAKAAEGFGVIVSKEFAAEDIKSAIISFASMAADLPRLSMELYQRTRSWTWPNVSATYEAAILNSMMSRRPST